MGRAGAGGLRRATAARARELNEAFFKLFDTELVEAGKRLMADPGDSEAKVEFVTIYHMIIEGALALTGQSFVTHYLEREGRESDLKANSLTSCEV